MTGLNQEMMRGLFMYGVAATMCLFGLFITLRSGAMNTRGSNGLRTVALNASQMAVRLSLLVAAFALLLEAIGAGMLLRGH